MKNAQILEEVYNCIKCGLCLTPCPVYKQKLIEATSPRGKIQLVRNILEGKLEPSENFMRILFTCLLCETCTVNCPSGLKIDQVLKAMRREIVKKYGLPKKKKLLFELLTGKRLLPFYLFWGRLLLNSLLPLYPGKGKLGTIPYQRLPRLNSPSFLERIPEINPVFKAKGRVLYFTGCATNYLNGDVGDAVLQVLSALGVEVITPKEQMCCGLPIFLAGAPEMAMVNIKNNISIFKAHDVEAIIVDCATCGSAFKKEYPRILAEMGEKTAEAEELSKKVLDISEYLVRFDLKKILKPLAKKVTYHDPCHLIRSQKIREEPRFLLQQIPELEFVEMAGADVCCGGGGTFQWEHPEIAAQITAQKVKNIEKTQAEIVATGCPGCRLQIYGNITNEEIKVLHPVQVLAMSLQDKK
jgi:glycolate oxidase iron-sulfur subunit